MTRGCHEEMTTDALRVARASLATAAPLQASREDLALIADLPFSPAADMTDLGGAALLVGVRDNDLLGRDPNDLSELAIVHGDPTLQELHCLHPVQTAEPGGSMQALADCRAFILGRVSDALEGLDATGRPDPTIRTSLPVYLALRHKVDASLPTYYVRIGQAIHTVEDVYAHTYRTSDQSSVTTVMDWVDEVEGDLHAETDGPPHSTEMDRCDDPDDFRRLRRELATSSATAMLQMTLDPTQTRAQKMAAVSAALDDWLSYSPGCSHANGWCDAPEREYGNVSLLSCDIASPARFGRSSAALAVLAVLVSARARRRRRGCAALVAVAAAIARPARADEPLPRTAAAAAAEAHVPPPRTLPVPEPGPSDRSQLAFGGSLGASGSAVDPAFGVAAGLRVRATLHWTFGLDAEWNPWIAINGAKSVRAGSFNGYAAAIFRVPLAYQRFNLRITGDAGFSRILIDLYGVAKGSTGIFGAIYPLGVEWKASRLFYVVLNPLGFAAPVPQLTGIPYWYPQYRATLAIEVYGG
ncbi:MAG TPA: hypothetical protein VHL80_03660 [Polyangia bacterium]|nr:hypothetical protein [Polyangia bacterium]